MRSETIYQAHLIKKLQALFPTAFVLKNDPSETQGIPDLLLLFNDRWAMLEVKLSATADIQPNQPYYIKMFDEMSFAAFIYPENEKQVLDDLQSAFAASREACVSKS
jgi:hypothetical protein